MLKGIRLVLLALTVFFTLPTLSVCPEMEVWSNGTNYRYFLGDCHADYIDGRVSLRQQADIIWAAQQKKAEGAFVVAEDNFSYSGTNKKVKQFWAQKTPFQNLEEAIEALQREEKIDKEKAKGSLQCFEGHSFSMSPLLGLIKECQKKLIQNYNIECNHVCVLYNSNMSAPYDITKQEVIEDLSETIAKTGDCEELYKMHVSIVKNLKILEQTAAKMDRKTFVQQAKEIRSDLVDLRIIHKLIHWEQYKHGFIFTGALHLVDDSLEDIMKKLGYKKIAAFGEGRFDHWFNLALDQKTSQETGKYMLANALDLKKTFQQIFAQQAKVAMQVSNQKNQAEPKKPSEIQAQAQQKARAQQAPKIKQEKHAVEKKSTKNKKSSNKKKIQKKTDTSSIISSIMNYKWPIAAGVAVVGAIAAWFYWGK